MLTGQLLSATAPANWTRSPALIVLCFCMNGIRLFTESSMPLLAAKLGSTVGNRSIEPSAPPPLESETVRIRTLRWTRWMYLRLRTQALRDGNGVVCRI